MNPLLSNCHPPSESLRTEVDAPFWEITVTVELFMWSGGQKVAFSGGMKVIYEQFRPAGLEMVEISSSFVRRLQGGKWNFNPGSARDFCSFFVQFPTLCRCKWHNCVINALCSLSGCDLPSYPFICVYLQPGKFIQPLFSLFSHKNWPWKLRGLITWQKFSTGVFYCQHGDKIQSAPANYRF